MEHDWPDFPERKMTNQESEMVVGWFYYGNLNDHSRNQVLAALANGATPEQVKEKTKDSLLVEYPLMEEAEREKYAQMFYSAAKYAEENGLHKKHLLN